jgi:hypothetical protein
MYCTRCEIGFSWTYAFVGPKQRYSTPFRSRAVEQALGSTAAHSTRMQEEALPAEKERIYEQVWEEAKASGHLVLGVDDFAIKKGHTYNTGIHNLRGETMLDVLPGRPADRCYGRLPSVAWLRANDIDKFLSFRLTICKFLSSALDINLYRENEEIRGLRGSAPS